MTNAHCNGSCDALRFAATRSAAEAPWHPSCSSAFDGYLAAATVRDQLFDLSNVLDSMGANGAPAPRALRAQVWAISDCTTVAWRLAFDADRRADLVTPA